MRMLIRASKCGAPLALITCGLLAAGCSSTPKRAPVTYAQEDWDFGPLSGTKLITPHYIIHTTVDDPNLVKTFPELVERAYDYYQSLVPAARAPQQKMPVYLLETRDEWAQFTQRFTGPRAAVFLQIRNGGYSENGVSVIQYVTNPVTFPLLAHEGFHQYLHHCVSPRVAAWINEGLAVVCEGQRWTTSGLREFDPWYNPVRRNQLSEALLKDRLFTLEQLLSLHAGNVIHETSTRIGTYYAQVWTLMLFLQEGADGAYADGFAALRRSLGDADLDRTLQAEAVFSDQRRLSRGEALFRRFISDDLAQVQAQYFDFLRQRLLNAGGRT